MKKSQAWLYIYILVLVGDVTGIAAGIDYLHVFCKPLLMPVLLWGLIYNKNNLQTSPWFLIAAGLFLSWAGDIFLLFDNKNPAFFIWGLLSFLMAHIFYIVYYFKCGASLATAFKNYKLWISLSVVYSTGLVFFLFPKLGALLVPVIAYAAVLSLMLIASIAAIPAVSNKSSALLVAGAVAFVVSDSLLAINKFYQPFAMAGVLIMITYGVAQLLITQGALANYQGSGFKEQDSRCQ